MLSVEVERSTNESVVVCFSHPLFAKDPARFAWPNASNRSADILPELLIDSGSFLPFGDANRVDEGENHKDLLLNSERRCFTGNLI